MREQQRLLLTYYDPALTICRPNSVPYSMVGLFDIVH